MSLWIPLTIASAFFQNLRFMLQKRLTQSGVSTAGATYARYIWSAPLGLLALAVVLYAKEIGLPGISLRFLTFITVGGVTQILATLCVVAMFSRRNFAVGAAFKKTETFQAAIIGVALLGDQLPWQGWILLAVGLLGVLLMSGDPLGDNPRVFSLSTGLGLLSGFLFGICGVCYRGASLALNQPDFVVSAMTALCFAIWIQLTILTVYLRLFEQGQIRVVIYNWRLSSGVGVFSFLGSATVLMSFTLQNVAYVTAVQQIELVFAALGSYFFFKERLGIQECLGILLIGVSIALLILVG